MAVLEECVQSRSILKLIAVQYALGADLQEWGKFRLIQCKIPAKSCNIYIQCLYVVLSFV